MLNNKKNLILNRFSIQFILEALEFILTNNNFKFDEIFYNQTEGTAMGTKCAPPYPYLVVGYKEETKLFPIELPKFFSTEELQITKEVLRRYMDDGFLLLNSIIVWSVCIIYIHSLITHMKKQKLQEKKEI